MAPFKKQGGFRSGGHSDFSRGGDRPRFANKGFSGGRDSRRDDRAPMQMHSATCAECGKTCEVPFRPTGERPVYCKDCFGARGDSNPTTRSTSSPFAVSIIIGIAFNFASSLILRQTSNPFIPGNIISNIIKSTG